MIEFRQVTKTYAQGDGYVTALNGIDLTIDDGEIFGIIGLSGAGKSTRTVYQPSRTPNFGQRNRGQRGSYDRFVQATRRDKKKHRYDFPEFQPTRPENRFP